jgi:hypothetical protein
VIGQLHADVFLFPALPPNCSDIRSLGFALRAPMPHFPFYELCPMSDALPMGAKLTVDLHFLSEREA